MALSPTLVKQNLRDLSVEELEAQYNALRKHYYFENPTAQVDYLIKNRLDVSLPSNNRIIKSVLEELIKEKTGQTPTMPIRAYHLRLTDVIPYLTKDPGLTTALYNFTKKLYLMPESQKVKFFIDLAQDHNSYQRFINEVPQSSNSFELYNKYRKAAKEYIEKNIKEF